MFSNRSHKRTNSRLKQNLNIFQQSERQSKPKSKSFKPSHAETSPDPTSLTNLVFRPKLEESANSRRSGPRDMLSLLQKIVDQLQRIVAGPFGG